MKSCLDRCRKCGKVIHRTEASAAKLAIQMRSNVKTLAGAKKAYNTTRAYPCPHGNGWHIGRPGKRRQS